MIAGERISANEKGEVLSTHSANLILVIVGLLGGLTVGLLLSALAVPFIWDIRGGRGAVTGFLIMFSILGAIAAKLLQKEYKINREAYKRIAEFRIPLVYPFFFISFLVLGVALLPVFDIAGRAGILFLVGAVILSPVLGIIWRFWYNLWLSILSPVDWRIVIEERNFNCQLKMSFVEVKRYPSPLSLTIMDIDQSDQLKGRALRRVQEELINIIDKNIREADVVGRIEGGRVVTAMAHTGSSGASVQAKRVKKILKEHLKSLKVGEKRITLSIGISSYALNMASYKDLIERAQIALRRSREEGEDQISIE